MEVIRKFQQGGVPEQNNEQANPLEAIINAALQVVNMPNQNEAYQAAYEVCRALASLASNTESGSGASANTTNNAPEAGAEPVFKKGGKLLRWVKRQ